jgi:hypothetical protein
VRGSGLRGGGGGEDQDGEDEVEGEEDPERLDRAVELRDGEEGEQRAYAADSTPEAQST